jgi:hypothetical protein
MPFARAFSFSFYTDHVYSPIVAFIVKNSHKYHAAHR